MVLPSHEGVYGVALFEELMGDWGSRVAVGCGDEDSGLAGHAIYLHVGCKYNSCFK